MKYAYVRLAYPNGSIVLRGRTRREIWDWMNRSNSVGQYARLEWMKRAPAPQDCLGGKRPRKPHVYRGDCIIVAMQRPDGSYVELAHPTHASLFFLLPHAGRTVLNYQQETTEGR